RSPIFETYSVVFARALEEGASPAALDGPDLARVLLGEAEGTTLSDLAVRDVTAKRFAYTVGDCCVFDWDAAFVLEPSGDRSVADVLEMATAQLLEFRYYDALFEGELLRMTALLRRPRAATAWLFVGRYGRVARRLQEMVLETTEFVERVENAVRVVGDLYLARLHRAAVERFRIPAWEAGVLRRQRAASEVATMLRDEAQAALGHALEATIVALILLEIGLAFQR
ncbi:MAG TPA: hypothetical protein VFS92_10670, partial [Planctomycetota bacterium]|nr:hypothetical protein [Planctomycetota bacterium]